MDTILIRDADRRFNQCLGRERMFRDRENPLEVMLPEECKNQYRFYPDTIDYLTKRLAPVLRQSTRRNNALLPITQVLIALEYLASGSFYRIVGSLGLISKSSVCKTLHKVLGAICDLSDTEIVFPADAALPAIHQKFFATAGIPSVSGVVDGCLIEIMKPSLNTDDYMCRKDYAAINVQVQHCLRWRGVLLCSVLVATNNYSRCSW
jgi:hypothetical protein